MPSRPRAGVRRTSAAGGSTARRRGIRRLRRWRTSRDVPRTWLSRDRSTAMRRMHFASSAAGPVPEVYSLIGARFWFPTILFVMMTGQSSRASWRQPCRWSPASASSITLVMSIRPATAAAPNYPTMSHHFSALWTARKAICGLGSRGRWSRSMSPHD